MCLRIKAFALTGRGDSTMRKPQGVASLALGYVLHWAFSPSLLNPKTSDINISLSSQCNVVAFGHLAHIDDTIAHAS